MALLVVDDLFKFYHPGDAEVRALRGASLTVAAGETVALVGPSGSGKSTLLTCIAGLDEPDGGTVTLAGQRMTRRGEAERAALRGTSIGFLAQSGNLFAHLSVADNIALQMELRGRGVDRDRIVSLLASVGLEHRADARPATLSGGEAARAGLAVALAVDPPLLIADEPTAEVDRETEARILDVLEERRARGGATLIATHSGAVQARASRVAAIEDGRIRESTARAPLKTVAQAPQNLIAAPVRKRVNAQEVPLIEAAKVTCAFTGAGAPVVAVDNVSCRIFPGERIAIVGPSGSGKSTLMNVLSGLEEPSGGSVAWPGLDAGLPLRPVQIAFAFQFPSLVPSLTVLENMNLPLQIADLRAPRAMDPLEALERFLLSDLKDKLPDQLSGGQMQRVALARALLTRPKVIFADEPTGQLDRATGLQVMHALLEALDGTDAALVIATHDPLVAEFMADRWQMDAGALSVSTFRKAVA